MEVVCRAITFINYHIPLTEDKGNMPHYSTVGFFDGMFTESLTVDYEKADLKELWKYTVRTTAESQGKFSYQNIFGFSEDSWNSCTDEIFWQEKSDSDYPLLFVTFLQVSDYMAGDITIEEQCRMFNAVLQDMLGDKGRFYTYGTIDKNDFVVCIRCRDHTLALNAIKKLHSTKSSVVYSYSVLSVSNKILNVIDQQNYPDIFAQEVDSICLKGITNSFNPGKNITLDQRYYEFCKKLIGKLYLEDQEERDYRIYDILGDDDFRLIARKVNLGKLLNEFGENGLLGNYQGDLRFYLYSSSLVLNTQTERLPSIDSYVKSQTILQMNWEMRSPLCEQLSSQMTKIMKTLKDNEADERKVTFCQALWQLLQSLKVLESAPTKQYDFYSLYHPFAALVRILEDKMAQGNFVSNNEIYEFIHKISMTLHGTLRTDIQFFQIRDFNVIVHYAPAKLRAFYAIWALKLSEFYNSFGQTDKRYSFILSPGVFGETHVKQLFTEYDERERLMLITTPERNLYIPRWLSLIIAHEVSHFVGTRIRERMFRHKILLRLTAHIAALEMQKFWYIGMPSDMAISTEKLLQSTYLRNQLKKELVRIDDETCESMGDSLYLYHTGNSQDIIRKDYRYISDNGAAPKIMSEYGEMLRTYLLAEAKASRIENSGEKVKRILDACNDRESQMLIFFERFQRDALSNVFGVLNFVCKETFADIVAVLTLALSPVEYVVSFVRSDYVDDDVNQDQNTMRLLPVRIAVTMNAVKTILHKNKEWLMNCEPEFMKAWEGDTFYDTIFQFDNNSEEQNIMIRTYGYKKNLKYHKRSIRNYIGMYNPDYKDETFSGKELDFLNDRNVFRLLSMYMNKCADTYFIQLKKYDGLRAMRKELLDTYQKLKCGSAVDVMQEVENFLQKHEQDC